MSKIFDVKNMYGQDFSVVTTNAPTNIIKSSQTKLLPNTILISSPEDEYTGLDNNLPSIFVTDYNAQPLQLTYPLYMKNGLNYSNKNGYAYINIDNYTITTEFSDGSGQLKVNTTNLDNATFNNKGVVQLSETSPNIDRQLSEKYKNNGGLDDTIINKYNSSTFININSDGILYLDNGFLGLINSIVDLKVKQKLDSIKIMLNNNLKMWIVIKSINGSDNTNDSIKEKLRAYYVGTYDHVDIDNDKLTSIMFDLQYLSFNNISEKIDIVDESDNIYKITFGENGNQTVVEQSESNDELYLHTVSDIEITFLPNYFILNNDSYDQNYQVLINVDNDKSESISFIQKKLNFIEGGEQKFDVNINTSELSVYNVLDADTEHDIIKETIKNDNIFSQLSDELDNDILQFNLNTSIVNNNDKNNNFIIADNVKCNFNQNVDNYEYIIKNKNNGVESVLYSFIRAIIDDNNTEEYKLEGGDNYNNTSVNINDYNVIKIGDFIDTSITTDNAGTSIQYSIDLLIEFEIKNIVNNKELGTYSKTEKVVLNLSKEQTNGYMNITSISMSKGLKKLIKSGSVVSAKITNTPNYIYYIQRSGNKRILANVDEYTGKDIDPSTLYCIFNDDLLFNDDANINATFTINHNGFKKYSSKNPNNDSNIALDNVSTDSNLCTINNNSIVYNLGNNNVERIKNINKLLGNGLTFIINFTKDNKNKSVSSQLVNLQVNILEILLNNISIKESNYTYDEKGKYLNNAEYVKNLNDYNDSLYYNMNNYVINNSINNNDIEKIYFNIPNYIIYALSEHNTKLNLTILFYYRNNIETATISISNVNDVVSTKLSSNISILVLNHASFDSTDDKDEHYFILTTNNKEQKLPKLLQFKFNFTFNDLNTNKLCYFTDNKSIFGGILQHKSYNNLLQSNEITQIYESNINSVNDKLYDIVYVNLSNEINKNKHKLLHNATYDQGIIVTDLQLSDDIQYPFTLSKLNQSTNNDEYNILLKLNNNIDNSIWNDISLEDTYVGLIYQIYYKYYYLQNKSKLLDDYNLYVDKSSRIDQQQLTVKSDNYIRFTEVTVNTKKDSITDVFYDESDNILTILSFDHNKGIMNILPDIMSIKINNGTTYRLYKKSQTGNSYDYVFNNVEIKPGKSLKNYWRTLTADEIANEEFNINNPNYAEFTVQTINESSTETETTIYVKKCEDNDIAPTNPPEQITYYKRTPKYWKDYNGYNNNDIFNYINFIDSELKIVNASNLLFKNTYALFLNNYTFELAEEESYTEFKTLHINNLYLGYFINYANVILKWNGLMTIVDNEEQKYNVEDNICIITINQKQSGSYNTNSYPTPISDSLSTGIMSTIINDTETELNIDLNNLYIIRKKRIEDEIKDEKISVKDFIHALEQSNSSEILLNDNIIYNENNQEIYVAVTIYTYPIYINELNINGHIIYDLKTKYSLRINYNYNTTINKSTINSHKDINDNTINDLCLTNGNNNWNEFGNSQTEIDNLEDIKIAINSNAVYTVDSVERVSPWIKYKNDSDVTLRIYVRNDALDPQSQTIILSNSQIESINGKTLDGYFNSYKHNSTTILGIEYSGNTYFKPYNKEYNIKFKEAKQTVAIKFINQKNEVISNTTQSVSININNDHTTNPLTAKLYYNGTPQNDINDIIYSSGNTTYASIINVNGENKIQLNKATDLDGVKIIAEFNGNNTYDRASAEYKLIINKDILPDNKFAWSGNSLDATIDVGITSPITLTNALNLPVSYSSGDTTVATIDNNGTITLKGGGTTSIIASTTGNEYYYGNTVQYTLNVSKGTLNSDIDHPNFYWKNGDTNINGTTVSITFGNTTDINNITLINKNGITLSSGLTVNSSESNVAGITITSGNTVHLVAGNTMGTAIISAGVYNNNKYNNIGITCTLSIKADLNSDIFGWYDNNNNVIDNLGVTFGDVNNTFPIFKHPEGLPISYNSDDTTVANINNNGTIALVGGGTALISASTTGNNYYNDKTVQYTLNVSKGTLDNNIFGWYDNNDNIINNLGVTFGDVNTFPIFKHPEDLQISYSSGNTTVATIDNTGVITLEGGGTASISASTTGDNRYNNYSTEYTLNVAKGRLNSDTDHPNFYWNDGTTCVDTVSYIIQTDSLDVLPTLVVPLGLTVSYNSSNINVADINNTGGVTIITIGDALITAYTEDDNRYYGNTVQYTLHVINSEESREEEQS